MPAIYVLSSSLAKKENKQRVLILINQNLSWFRLNLPPDEQQMLPPSVNSLSFQIFLPFNHFFINCVLHILSHYLNLYSRSKITKCRSHAEWMK